MKGFENPCQDFGQTPTQQQIWRNISLSVPNASSTIAEKDRKAAMEFTTIFGHETNYAITIQDFITLCLKLFHVKMSLSNAVTTRVKRTNISGRQKSMAHNFGPHFDRFGEFVCLTLVLTWIRNKFIPTKSK